MLAGIVDVQVVGGNLYLYGDGSNNQVEIYQNAAVGSFHISSPDDTLFTFNAVNPPTFEQLDVNGIVGNIEVYLADGNDEFTFLGRLAGGMSSVQQNLYIENEDGSDVNEIVDTLVNGYLEVFKNAASSGYSEFTLRDSKIIEYLSIDNVGNGFGDTKTVIDDSTIEDYFEIYNPVGSNVVDVLANSQFGTGTFIAAQPIVYIENAGGASRISFAGSSQVAGPGTTTVYGSIEIINGDNAEGTLNLLTMQSLNVLGEVCVFNDDGDTKTMVLNAATGSANVTPPGGAFNIENYTGFDAFEMKDSYVPWGLYIDNDALAGGTSTYGSTTNLTNNTIGVFLDPLNDYAVTIYGDDGADDVIVAQSTIGADLYLSLYDGQNSATLLNNVSIAGFEYYGGDGDDIVTIDNSKILYYVYIYLYEGADELHMLNMDYATEWPSILLGNIEIDAGLGVDTLFGAKPPANLWTGFEFELP
jgi:hypothetical protein